MKSAQKTLLFLLLSSPLALSAALLQTSFASWYDARGAAGDTFFGHVNVYALQANTTINLYRVNTENTSIAGAPVATWTSTVANQPFHYPVNTASGPNDDASNWYWGTSNAFYRLVATHATAPAGTNLVNWDLNSPDKNTYLDSHTFLVGESGTYLANLFHSFLFYNDINSGNNAAGMSLAVINPGATTLNVTVNKWNSGGSTWNAAPATSTGGNTVALGPGKIWMYGGVTKANTGDYQVVITGGGAIVYKGCMFELDHDNSFMAGADQTGYKLGTTLYGSINTDPGKDYGPTPGSDLVLTAFGGPSTVDLYYYTYSGTGNFPATTAGSWNLWTSGVAVPANGSVSIAPGKAGVPAVPGSAGSRGMFIKAVATGAPIQMECGANIMSGVAGDGDWLASDNGRALGTSFHPANGNYDNAYLTNNANPRIVVIMPSAATNVQVTSPAAPAKAAQAYTSVAAYEAHSFDMALSTASTDIARTWNVVSDKPVYCFLETAGTLVNEMEKMYSAVAPVPGVDMSITKVVDKLQADPGSNLTYAIVATNYGSETATSVAVWDTIPLGLVMPPVSDSQSALVTVAGSSGSMRRWVFPSIAPAGGSVTVVMTLQIDPSQAAGTTTFANQASVLAGNDAIVHDSGAPAVSYAVQAANSCWEGYSSWEDNPPSGSQNEAFVHIYALHNGTTFTLTKASTGSTTGAPATINTLESSFSLNAGQSTTIGPINTRFYRLSSNYPAVWELDSQNVLDRDGHDMMVYSTQMKYADHEPFLSYLDYYHKTGCGTPDCNANPGLGDALVLQNPSASVSVTAQVYNSSNNGVTWNFVGNYTVGYEASVLVGGATNASFGDYVVVPYGDAVSQGKDLIVYKGNSISLNGSALTDGGGSFGSSNLGTRSAVSTGDRIYGMAGNAPGSTIVISGQGGTANWQIFRYVPTGGATANWPISGNTGSWTSLGTGTVTAGAAPAAFTAPAKGIYKAVKTGGAGSFTAMFGGAIFKDFSYGDGDMVGSVDNLSADWLASGGSNTLLKGKDFYFASGSSAGGTITVIAPKSGTTVSVTGALNTGGTFGSTTTGTPPASSANDQVWRFVTSGTNTAYHVTASQDSYVVYQSPSTDHEAKAFGGAPLVLCVVTTPTPSNTPTVSPTVTPTRTPTATPSASPTHTPSPTPSPSPSASPTASPSKSPTSTFSSTLTGTPSPSPSASPTASPTRTPTATPSLSPTATPSRTPSFTATDTITPGPTPTFTLSYTFSPTSSVTLTPSPTITLSATPTATSTNSDTPTITPTVTVTTPFSPTNSPTITLSFTASDTPTATLTPTASASPTPSFTDSPTPTFSASPSGTPSGTATRTDSPTLTGSPTETPSSTATPTATVSATVTETPSISPTFTPNAPFRASLAVYNSAGEKVAELGKGIGLYVMPQGLKAVDAAFAPDSGGKSSIMILGPDQLIYWDGANNNGQLVASGDYYVKMEIKNNFGLVSSYQTEVAVLRQALGIEIEIFNSAGEVVWHGLTKTASPSGSLAFSGKTLSPDAAGSSTDISWGPKPGQSFAWDGRGSDGQVVATGSYTVRLRDLKTGAVSAGSITVIVRPMGGGVTPKIWPNPLGLRDKVLSIDLQGALAGLKASARIYNAAGEMVGAAVNAPNYAQIAWEASRISGGIYLVVIELNDGSGIRQRRLLKLAVLR